MFDHHSSSFSFSILILLLPITVTASATITDHVTINLDSPTTSFPHYWKLAFGTGHATLTLRSDWQNSLTQATTDLGLQGVRGHGIFDDDMGVVIAPRTYNFTLVEKSWRFQVDNNVTPIVELSFMPAILANCTWTAPTDSRIVNPGHTPCNNTVMQYQGITVLPTSFDDWYDLVQSLVQHAVDIFGTAEVEKWTFEVCKFHPICHKSIYMFLSICFYDSSFFPCLTDNLFLFASFFSLAFHAGNELWGIDNITPQYMSLYNASALAVKSVSTTFHIGGPATARLQYVTEFVHQATAMNLPFDFVSTHMYPTDPQCPTGKDWGPDCLPRNVRALKENLLNIPSFKKSNVPLYLTEYNAGCGVGYPQHDTSGAAAFAFRTIGELEGTVGLLSWWTFSDIFEENTAIEKHTEYMNVYGLMTKSGIPKPSWRAFQLLHELAGTTRLNTTVTAVDAVTAVRSAINAVQQDVLTSSDCTIEQNTIMKGFDLEVASNVYNITACCAACQHNSQCTFWSFEKSKSVLPAVPIVPMVPLVPAVCSLKTSDAGRTRMKGVTSGSSLPPPVPKMNGTRISALATIMSRNGSEEGVGGTVAVFLSFWSITNEEKNRTVSVTFNGMDSSMSSAAAVAMEYRIDLDHANSKSEWVRMGSPSTPTKEQIKILIESSRVIPTALNATEKKGVFIVNMPPNSAVVIVLE